MCIPRHVHSSYLAEYTGSERADLALVEQGEEGERKQSVQVRVASM